MSDLVLEATNHAQKGTQLVGQPDNGGGFGNNHFVLRLDQSSGLWTTGPIDGLQSSVRDGVGVRSSSVENDGVFGTSEANDKTGVVGINDNNVGVFGRGNATAGVLGHSSGGNGVEGDSSMGVGVLGRSGSGNGVVGSSVSDSGVSGSSTSGVGVRGGSAANDGIVGTSDAGDRSGVVGLNGSNVGVFGRGRFGVVGTPAVAGGTGVLGRVDSGIGVMGSGNGGIGVYAQSANGIGLYAEGSDLWGAAFLAGKVNVVGDFQVWGGAKSAAVRHPDGSHRLLYCLESPESWFEDFGEAKLVQGKADVRLDPDFAAVVKINQYHVFLTPCGDSHGLYVAKRTPKGFQVREQQGGKSSLTFSYRVVARRKGIEGKRLAKVTLPRMPSLPEAPKLSLHKTGRKKGRR